MSHTRSTPNASNAVPQEAARRLLRQLLHAINTQNAAALAQHGIHDAIWQEAQAELQTIGDALRPCRLDTAVPLAGGDVRPIHCQQHTIVSRNHCNQGAP